VAGVELAPGGHVGCVYDTAAERRKRLVDWARAGLTRDERVVHIEPDGSGSLPRHLQQAGVDLRDATGRPRVNVVATVQQAVRLAAEAGRRVRIAGDGDVHAQAGSEPQLDALAAAGLASVLCLFPRSALDPRAGGRLARDHPCGLRDAGVELVRTGSHIRVHGEVDRTNAHLLACVLDAAEGTEGGAAVTVDLGDLSFIDLGGIRALVETATRMTPGRRLKVSPPSRAFLRVVRLAGADRVENLDWCTR
jgi:anti-anti-sigma factor